MLWIMKSTCEQQGSETAEISTIFNEGRRFEEFHTKDIEDMISLFDFV